MTISKLIHLFKKINCKASEGCGAVFCAAGTPSWMRNGYCPWGAPHSLAGRNIIKTNSCSAKQGVMSDQGLWREGAITGTRRANSTEKAAHHLAAEDRIERTESRKSKRERTKMGNALRSGWDGMRWQLRPSCQEENWTEAPWPLLDTPVGWRLLYFILFIFY